jgi:hypothetical protein
MKALMLAAGLVSVAAVATAAQPQPDLPEAKDNDQSRVVCVQSNEIGSRLRQRRTCRTKAQWDEYRANVRMQVARKQSIGEAPGD